MRPALLLLSLVPVVSSAAGLRHFELEASFLPAKKAGGLATVAVSFQPLDPDLRLNESPAPRLNLDLNQVVLLDKQLPTSAQMPDFDPFTAKYHDLAKPVTFPVAVAPTAPKGAHLVKASVVFFYCSQREAWCRRGTAEVEIPVTVR